MPTVVNLQNPRALLVPEVAALIKRAVESVDFAAPGGVDSVAEDMYIFVTNSQFFFLLGMEDGAPKAMCTGYFPSSRLFPYPVVSLIYNEGSRELLKEMAKGARDTITQAGYTRAWAINGSGRNDDAWCRLIAPKGTKAKRLASVMEIAVT